MKALIIALLVVLLLVLTTATAFAAGGKVHGEKGQGEVHQVQVQDPFVCGLADGLDPGIYKVPGCPLRKSRWP